jgi:hypothetical protein
LSLTGAVSTNVETQRPPTVIKPWPQDGSGRLASLEINEALLQGR